LVNHDGSEENLIRHLRKTVHKRWKNLPRKRPYRPIGQEISRETSTIKKDEKAKCLLHTSGLQLSKFMGKTTFIGTKVDDRGRASPRVRGGPSSPKFETSRPGGTDTRDAGTHVL